jgi:putative transposon-encoded protein
LWAKNTYIKAIKYLSRMNPSMEVKLEAYQVIEKIVKSSGNSGRVYVPKEWIGRRVKVLLMEPTTEINNKDK